MMGTLRFAHPTIKTQTKHRIDKNADIPCSIPTTIDEPNDVDVAHLLLNFCDV